MPTLTVPNTTQEADTRMPSPTLILLGTRKGAFILEIVQKSGGKKLSASEFLIGHTLHIGDRFE